MSELGFLAFGLPDEVNPVEAAQQKAAAVQKINEELETRGIVAFALKADSIPEVEQRLLMREVDNQINEIVATYLPGDDDAKQRVVSNIFKKFEASKKFAETSEDDHDPYYDPQESEIANGTRCENCREPLPTKSAPNSWCDHCTTIELGKRAGTHCDECGGKLEVPSKKSYPLCPSCQTNYDGVEWGFDASVKTAEEKMPMKDGKPAFLSDDEDEDEEDDDEDEDSEDSEDEKKDSEDEDSEDDDDEDDSSNEKEASLTHLARKSRACELGNHSTCTNCGCNCHAADSSAACTEGDHADCRVNDYAESEEDKCGCGCHA